MPRLEIFRTALRFLIGAVYLAAGVAHLRFPGPFVQITPGWVPAPELVVAATGVAEILGAVALMFVLPLRRAAAIALAAYAVCVYPANVKHAMEGIGAQDWRYHAPRLAFQPVFVWWALFAGGVIDWPWRRRK